jgi:CheY-like chemotaxis protein
MIHTQVWINHPSQASQIALVTQEMDLVPHIIQVDPRPSSFDLPLGGLWILYDQGQSTLDVCNQIRSQSKSIFWGILIVGEAPESHHKACLEQGADRYLAYPFDRPVLAHHIRRLIDEKTPVSLYNVLPPKLANAIDKISLKLDQLNYYELLELKPEAESKEI